MGKGGSSASTLQHQNEKQVEEETTVINMSASILSKHELNVLSKGLNFCPTKNFNLYNTILDVNRFARSLTLRKHFCNLSSRGMSVNPVTTSYVQSPSFLPFSDQVFQKQ